MPEHPYDHAWVRVTTTMIVVGSSMEALLRQVPLYTVADAAHFTGASAVDVRRWVAGYSYRGHRYEPVSQPAEPVGDVLYLTFHHLIEVWAIKRMRESARSGGGSGLSLQKIRRGAVEARTRFGRDFPLADERLRWDGAGIFAAIPGAEAIAEGLVELSPKAGQATWSEFVADGLQRIDYADKLAMRLWPLGKEHAVALDPRLRDGWPTLFRDHETPTGIPADAVAEMVRAGDSIDDVADAYRIERQAVVDAVDFVATWSGVAA